MTEPRAAAGLLALGLLLSASSAAAEPHFSARTGLRCARCHTSPTGGGKRTPYGALYAYSSLAVSWTRPRATVHRGARGESSWRDSLVVSGEVTSWLAVGADLRVSNTTTFAAADDEEHGNSFDATEGNLYLELRPWPSRLVLYLDEQVAAGGASSREAWAMVRGPWSTHLRAGWLLPPFGLRLLDDAAYTRRVTGANFANPDMGLELGIDRGPLFAAVALTNGSFSARDNDHYKALWGLVELNLDAVRLGLSGQYNPSEQGCRSMVGTFAAVRLGRLVLQGELDMVADRPADKPRWGYGLTGMAEADVLLTRGLALRAGYDYHDADLELGQDRRQRFRFGVDLFLLRMVELKLYYVHKQSETNQPSDEADRLEVTLHAFM